MVLGKKRERKNKEWTYHDPSQGLSVGDEPTGDQQAHCKENGHDSQPVPPSPPKSQKKTDTQDNTGDLAGNDIKARENQERPDHGRSQIAGRQSDGTYSALHVGHSTLVRIKRDGLDFSTSAAGCDRVTKFMKCDHQHLTRQR